MEIQLINSIKLTIAGILQAFKHQCAGFLHINSLYKYVHIWIQKIDLDLLLYSTYNYSQCFTLHINIHSFPFIHWSCHTRCHLLIRIETEHSHTLTQRGHSLREQIAVQCLAQWHFNMYPGGAGDQTVEPMIRGRVVLPPKPHSLMNTLHCENTTWFFVLYARLFFGYMCAMIFFESCNRVEVTRQPTEYPDITLRSKIWVPLI